MGKMATTSRAQPLTGTERRLTEIWKAVLGLDEVDRTADFFELGGHSLTAVRLLAVVNESFGCRLTVATLIKSPSIESFGKELESSDERECGLRQVSRLFPAVGGEQIFGINSIICYDLLAKQLGQSRPLTCLQLFDQSHPPAVMDETFEQIAAQYVQLIRRIQPKGPYRLLGYCVGALLAFEVAQQLIAEKEEVSYLAMIEANAGFLRHGRFAWLRSQLATNYWRIKFTISDIVKLLTGENTVMEFFKSRGIFHRVLWHLRRGSNSDEKVLLGLSVNEYESWLMLVYLASAAKKYQLKVFPGKLHVFGRSVMRKGLFVDDSMGWGPFAAGGVELSLIDGDHSSVLRLTGVNQIVEKINAALDSMAEPV
jgi:thioesterase domain-containing protein